MSIVYIIVVLSNLNFLGGLKFENVSSINGELDLNTRERKRERERGKRSKEKYVWTFEKIIIKRSKKSGNNSKYKYSGKW